MTRSAVRSLTAVVASTLGFAAVTALVFLVRAGDASESNWPVTWELRSSDNGVLFQFAQDLFAGRSLDWSFSPQVYVFPELPISVVAYALALGNVYVYFLIVAMLNNALLFLAIFAVLRRLSPADGPFSSLARAALASTPLVILPLVGTAWILSFPLAPTYYFGMYLVLLGGPLLVLARGRVSRAALVVAVGLAAASNPLMLVFALPAFGVTLVVLAIGSGMRAAVRTAVPVAAALVLAVVVRLLFFGRLEGTSPLTYVDVGVFEERWRQLGPYYGSVMQDEAARVILVVGGMLALACVIGAVVAIVAFLRRRLEPRNLTFVYLQLVPVLGIAGTAAVLITHYLYFWPALILPYVVVLMVFPAPWAKRALAGAGVVFVAVAVSTGLFTNLAHLDRYFGHRNAETLCIDEGLPAGVTVGYSTFSDARRLALTSQTPFRLVQLQSDGSPAFWLTNRAYLSDAPGQFFYINGRGDEWPIDVDFLVDEFGEPDSRFSCGEDQEVLVYTAPDKLDAIARYYEALRP